MVTIHQISSWLKAKQRGAVLLSLSHPCIVVNRICGCDSVFTMQQLWTIHVRSMMS